MNRCQHILQTLPQKGATEIHAQCLGFSIEAAVQHRRVMEEKKQNRQPPTKKQKVEKLKSLGPKQRRTNEQRGVASVKTLSKKV